VRKIALLITVLSLSACKTLEDAPAVWQCQYNGSPRKFFCKNTHTGERRTVPADSSSMKAAQCLSADDFRSMQNYVDYLIDEAQRRCQ
jgi:hypothetical protein